jgi:hypothetical protein
MENLEILIENIKSNIFLKMFDEEFIKSSYYSLKTLGFYKVRDQSNLENENILNSFLLKNLNDYKISCIKDLYMANKKSKLKQIQNKDNLNNLITNKSDIKDELIKNKSNQNTQLLNLIMQLENESSKKDAEKLLYNKQRDEVETYFENIRNHKAFEILISNNRLYKEYFSKNPSQEKFFKLQDKIFKNFFNMVANETDFEDRSNKDAKVFFKQDKDGLAVIKFEKEIKCNLVNFLKLIYECDYYKIWFPFIKSSYAVATVGLAQKIIYMINDLPLLTNRDFLVYGFGINKFQENNKVYVLSASIDDEPEFKNYKSYKSDSGNVRGKVNIFGWEIEKLNEESLKLKGLISIDPKIQFIPNSLLNLALTHMTKTIFEQMMIMLKDYEKCPAYNKNPTNLDLKVYNILEKEIYKK